MILQSVIFAAILFVALPVSAWAQVLAPSVDAGNLPRTADGQPDIQGFWKNPERAVCDLETGFCQEENSKIQGFPVQGMSKALLSGKPVSTVIDPPDGKIPYQNWASEKRRTILEHYNGPLNLRQVDPQAFCLTGAPRLSANIREFEFVQVPGYVLMVWEWQHAYRVIDLDRGSQVPATVKLAMGDARGHWVGNELIVETSNIKDWSWFDSVGTFHSDALKTVERFTLIDGSTIRYRATVDDPKVFTQPWTFEMMIKRVHSAVEGYERLEDACVEGNERTLRNMLHGKIEKGDEYTSPGRPGRR